MRGRAKLLAMISVVLLASCGKHRSQPADKAVGSGSAVLHVPDGFDASKVQVTTLPFTGGPVLPRAIERYTVKTLAHFEVLQIAEVTPEVTVPAGTSLVLSYDPKAVPAGVMDRDLRAVLVGERTFPEDLPVEISAPGQLTVHPPHLGHVLVLAPKPDLELAGTPAAILRGIPADFDDQCTRLITPQAPRVMALAQDKVKLAIDPDGRGIHLDPLPKLTPMRPADDKRTAEQVLAAGEGDSVNLSVMLASVFLARGYPVALSAGMFRHERKQGKTLAGLWQWALVSIDDQTYAVDTFDMADLRLVPLDSEAKNNAIRVNRTCVRTPEGKTVPASAWLPTIPPGP